MDSTGDGPPSPPPPPAYTSVPRTFHREPTAPPRVLSWASRCWFASFAALAITLINAGVARSALRSALESGLAAQNPGTSAQSISDTVLLTLIGCATVAVLLALGEGLCMVRLHAGSSGARTLLAALGILNVVGLVVVWELLSDAGSVAGGALRWGPVAQGALIVAGLAMAFTPPVGRWLSGRN
ncbi:hypothetical protein G4X40_08240 [Rhodococcus sp. D2-41]|uniref:hypothetical protein n=1 Tax=Speluncibacter jeojiensis TaxID=2710754 RepID=UPI00240FA154|nr:hypothetical protein [Rhodococcus sp. D2-41]MDG3010139.1 hypothetical protein [Rhodococcus sp. D2-41]